HPRGDEGVRPTPTVRREGQNGLRRRACPQRNRRAGRADPGSKGENMNALPSVDESFERLHRAGWSVGEVATGGEWIVTGRNGENVLEARGQTQAEAWWQAWELGMLGDLPRVPERR